jgi:predicted O-methyltransferase YrrM
MLEQSLYFRNAGVRRYIDQLFGQEDDILQQAALRAKDLAPIQIPIHVGKFIQLLAKIQGCKRILEIGTLGGYSTIWLARALLPQGKLLSIEIDAHCVEIAQANIQAAGLNHSVEILNGSALDILPKMIRQKEPCFDFFFIDANKDKNQEYLSYCLQLARPYSLIVIDNLIPRGDSIGYACNHEARFIYTFNQYVAQHPQLEIAFVPSIADAEGKLDGLAVMRVLPL